MGFNCGIVGLPNVGKSTIFNALTAAGAESANYPFCTIEPNTGIVPLPDARLNVLAQIAGSKEIIPTSIEFVDIAGLVKGASKGEGLGNQFLNHIRAVDAIVHVVRCFEDDQIIHVHGQVSPRSDVEIIETELLLSDLSSVERRIERSSKAAKSGDKELKRQLELLIEAKGYLDQGISLRSIPEAERFFELELLTCKPMFYAANVSEAHAAMTPEIATSGPLFELVSLAKEQGAEVVVISGKVEEELSQLDPAERGAFLEDLGLKASGLERLALAGYQILHLMSFFTVGPKETHAWTCKLGTRAPQAAGKIHTDFEHGFIRAEVIAYDDYVRCKGEVGARDQGKMRVEGKEYLMQDGDIVHFRFNV